MKYYVLFVFGNRQSKLAGPYETSSIRDEAGEEFLKRYGMKCCYYPIQSESESEIRIGKDRKGDLGYLSDAIFGEEIFSIQWLKDYKLEIIIGDYKEIEINVKKGDISEIDYMGSCSDGEATIYMEEGYADVPVDCFKIYNGSNTNEGKVLPKIDTDPILSETFLKEYKSEIDWSSLEK